MTIVYTEDGFKNGSCDDFMKYKKKHPYASRCGNCIEFNVNCDKSDENLICQCSGFKSNQSKEEG